MPLRLAHSVLCSLMILIAFGGPLAGAFFGGTVGFWSLVLCGIIFLRSILASRTFNGTGKSRIWRTVALYTAEVLTLAFELVAVVPALVLAAGQIVYVMVGVAVIGLTINGIVFVARIWASNKPGFPHDDAVFLAIANGIGWTTAGILWLAHPLKERVEDAFTSGYLATHRSLTAVILVRFGLSSTPAVHPPGNRDTYSGAAALHHDDTTPADGSDEHASSSGNQIGADNGPTA